VTRFVYNFIEIKVRHFHKLQYQTSLAYAFAKELDREAWARIEEQPVFIKYM